MTGTFPTPESVQPLQPTAAPVEAPAPVEDINQLIMDWNTATKQLAAMKEREKELRDRVATCQLWNPEMEVGTQTHRLGGGWEIKLTRRETVSVDNKDGKAAAVYNQLAAMGPGSADRVSRLFTFSARMSETVYKELTAEERAIVDTLLTRKPTTPTLKLKPPKED